MTKFILLFFICFKINAFELPKIEKYNWNGIDVVYLEDNQIPTYDFITYFSDGAISDGKIKGLTNWMFSSLDLGTTRYTRYELSDFLEYFGVSWGPSVIHEYSTYQVSGLVKDIKPTMKNICHIFSSATFPKKELKKQKALAINALNNIVNNHRGLANMAFREISLKNTPYQYSVGGKLKDIKKINGRLLKNHLSYFNTIVKKRIYLRGPRSILKIENIIKKDCHWSGKSTFVRKINFNKRKFKNRITLVTVPKANQVRIMLGRFLNQTSFEKSEMDNLTSKILGRGGFASLLMKKLRVEKSLTYGASSYISNQKYYGRCAIQTFTKNENLVPLLGILKNLLTSIEKGQFSKQYFANSKKSLLGAFPFKFESKNSYLNQLLFLDHIGQNYSYFNDYKANISKIKKEDILKNFKSIFDWDSFDIVILGEKKLLPVLKKKFKNVKAVSYKKFL